MDTAAKLQEIIEELGFDEYRNIPTSEIIFSEDVFSQCARNTCGNYHKNYACPPLSGDLETNKNRMLKYSRAFIVNKVVPMRTRAQMAEGMKTTAELITNLRKATEEMDNVMVVGPGGCNICKSCAAIDDEPCRFPDKTQYSMEGSGIDIVKMSQEQKMTYNGGERGLGYFFLALYND